MAMEMSEQSSLDLTLRYTGKKISTLADAA